MNSLDQARCDHTRLLSQHSGGRGGRPLSSTLTWSKNRFQDQPELYRETLSQKKNLVKGWGRESQGSTQEQATAEQGPVLAVELS